MPKYMTIARYTPEGIRGLMKDGGTGRRAAVEKAITGMGGSLEAFYFGFGDDDAYVVTDAPDNISAAAVSLTIWMKTRI
jgi:uncharacterized protein with GYD domain